MFELNCSKMARYLARKRQSLYHTMLKVNHSGELGADRIYCGQMYALRNDPKHAPMIQEMWDQEKAHLEYFSKQILLKRGSKSLLALFWDVAGLTVGVVSGLMGPQAAMATTVAVEDTITKHYNSQIRTLIADDLHVHKEFVDKLSQIRDDEQEHHDTGLANEAEQAIGYKLINAFITNGCKVAIQIAQRI